MTRYLQSKNVICTKYRWMHPRIRMRYIQSIRYSWISRIRIRYIQGIDIRESPGFGRGIYGLSVQTNLPDSDAITVQVKSDECLAFNLPCVPWLIGTGRWRSGASVCISLGELRSRSVSRVSSAARYGCAVESRESVSRDRRNAGGTRAGDNIQFSAASVRLPSRCSGVYVMACD